MTYVCITGNEQSSSALEQRIERVFTSHPRVLCELRLDYLDLNPAAAFSFLARLPAELAPRLVLTQRLKASGGTANGRCGWDVLTWQSWWRDVMILAKTPIALLEQYSDLRVARSSRPATRTRQLTKPIESFRL